MIAMNEGLMRRYRGRHNHVDSSKCRKNYGNRRVRGRRL